MQFYILGVKSSQRFDRETSGQFYILCQAEDQAGSSLYIMWSGEVMTILTYSYSLRMFYDEIPQGPQNETNELVSFKNNMPFQEQQKISADIPPQQVLALPAAAEMLACLCGRDSFLIVSELSESVRQPMPPKRFSLFLFDWLKLLL